MNENQFHPQDQIPDAGKQFAERALYKKITQDLLAEAEKAKAILEAESQQKMQYLQQLKAAINEAAADLNHMAGRVDQANAHVELLKEKLAALETPAAATDTPTDTHTPETVSEA